MTLAQTIAKHLHGIRSGDGYLCRCPVATHGKGRGDRSPSLAISEGRHSVLRVHCFAGCDARDVLDELHRRGLVHDERSQSTPKPAKKPAPPPVEPNSDALALWRSAQPITGTIAESYLRSRSIVLAPPSLRFLPDYEHIAGRVYLPAMIAALQDGDRRLIAVQVTMIDPRGDRKAQIKFPRKTFGEMRDGAVRLAAAGERLGLAEGIETGLSAMQLFGVPTWCALGAGRMHKVTIPNDVRELHVFADNDDAGRKAVERITNTHHHRRVIVHRPQDHLNDFNNVLLALLQTERAA